MSLMPPPLSLYIHFPWCVKKCPYCDFNSHQQQAELPESAYIDALISDLEQDLPSVWGRSISTIFMGGGTPSLFSPTAFDRLLSAVSSLLPIRPDAEVTMEANPGTLEYAPMAEYRDAGINRLSMGVQSFDDGLLKKIGRIHSSKEAVEAIGRAQAGGFDRINIDLMYALPDQSIEQSAADVAMALSLSVSHLSHYQLTIEPNTLFHAKPPTLPVHDEAWHYQEKCQQIIEEAGLMQYEVSAYAIEGQACQHNLNYWRFGDYLGIGAGAHGKVTSGATNQVTRTIKQRHPKYYLKTANSDDRLIESRILSDHDLAFEFVLNALRLNQGFDVSDYTYRTGLKLDLDDQPWSGLISDDLICQEGMYIKTTEKGRNYLNDVTERFL